MRWIAEALAQLEADSMLRAPGRLAWETATTARIGDRRVEVFCSNDYLGLRWDPRAAAGARAAIDAEGTGAGASRLVVGNLSIHETLERTLADWIGTPAALLGSSGYAANVGALAALAGADDVVFSDGRNHASLIDGCRLSRARVVVYRHNDIRALEAAIQAARPFRRGWIVTESVFSMDGDVAPLADLRALADRETIHLFADEAHAIGVLGPEGTGALRAAGVRADVCTLTLGKAIGASGAAILGDEPLRAFLWNKCRSFVFSTGVAPSVAGAALAAVGVVRSDPDLRARLARNTALLRSSMARAGFDVAGDSRVPIVPWVVGDAARALDLSAALLERGFLVTAIRPPTVPPGTARLRITVSAAHAPDAIQQLVAALGSIA